MLSRSRSRMRTYWVIAPYNHKKRSQWEKVWRFDVDNGIISIGWYKLGDVSSLGKQELREKVHRTYSDARGRSNRYNFESMWDFYHSIRPGDIIVARGGVKKIVGIGTVTQKGYYERDKNPYAIGDEGPYNNHLGVRWKIVEKEFDNPVFLRDAIYKITKDEFDGLIKDTAAPSEPEQWTRMQPEEDKEAFPEGRELFRKHRARERSGRVIERAKSLFLQKHGRFFCEACGFDFEKVYGDLGHGFIEAH